MVKKRIGIISFGNGGILHYNLDLCYILQEVYDIYFFTNEDVSCYSFLKQVTVVRDLDLSRFNAISNVFKRYPKLDVYHIGSFHPSLYYSFFWSNYYANRVILTIHDCKVHPYSLSVKAIKMRLAFNKILLRRVLKKVKIVLCLSSFVASQARVEFGVNAGIIKLANFKFKFEQISKTRFIKNKEHVHLLYFGTIDKYKGVEHVINLLNYLKSNEFNNIKIVIAGRIAKPYKKVLNSFKEALIFDRFIHDQEVHSFFSNSDVLLAPYDEVSQSGVVSLSLSYQLPVIASSIGSFSEFIKPSNGLLLEEMSPINILNAVNSVLAMKKYRAFSVFDDLELKRNEYLSLYSLITK